MSQPSSKSKNLKTKYGEIKDNNNKTGRGRKSCKFYKELDRILGHRGQLLCLQLFWTQEILTSESEAESASESEAESEEEVNGKEMNMI